MAAKTTCKETLKNNTQILPLDILERFSKINLPLNDAPDNDIEYEKNIRCVFFRLKKLINFINHKHSTFTIEWVNYWLEKSEWSQFLEKNNDRCFFINIYDPDVRGEIENIKYRPSKHKYRLSKHIYYFTKKDDSEKTIYSSKKLLRKAALNQSMIVFSTGKYFNSSAALNVSISPELLVFFKKYYDKHSGEEDKKFYKASLNIIRRCDTKFLDKDVSEFFEKFAGNLHSDKYQKFVNWLFWVRNLYPDVKWHTMVYMHGSDYTKDVERQETPKSQIVQGDHLDDYFCCNIGIGGEKEPDKQILDTLVAQFNLFLNRLSFFIQEHEKKQLMLKQLYRNAVISILIDSYAHNMSAHSLVALEWWFWQRSKTYDGIIEKPRDILNNEELEQLRNNVKEYTKTLGLTGNNQDPDISYMDLLRFYGDKTTPDSKRSEPVSERCPIAAALPVSLDYAIFPFLRFLRDKGAFWSGVTRDITFGGESKTWFKILWEDFANNPLYLGTIARSEGISKVNLYIHLPGHVAELNHFVSIDMELMYLETQDKAIATINKASPKDSFQTNPKTYNDYGFVRLGKDFEKLRQTLDTDDYKVFLPGGIVGEHALFTIFENNLRNAKHLKLGEGQKHIDLHISICPHKVIEQDKNPRLFKVGLWLQDYSPILRKDGSETKSLLVDLTTRIHESILDTETGAPRLGGNSQDKICAAMLLLNNFHAVESNDHCSAKLHKLFYPWLEYVFKTNPETYKLEISPDMDAKVRKQVYQQHIGELCGESLKPKGSLIRYFHLWRADDILELDSNTDLEYENPARFRFVVINEQDNEKISKLERYAHEQGIIRVISKQKNDGNLEVNSVYNEWNRKFLGITSNTVFNLYKNAPDNTDPTPLGGFYINNDDIKFVGSEQENKSAKCNPYKEVGKINFDHASIIERKREFCNVRSHSWFMKDFLRIHTIDDIEDLNNEQINNLKAFEFIEAMLTRVAIFDKRVYQRIDKNEDGKPCERYKKELNLEIYPEDKVKFNNFCEEQLKKTDHFHLIVIHLSFIEDMMKSKDNIIAFIEKCINPLRGGEVKPFLVITTGRGRIDWWEKIKKARPEFLDFTFQKPIESILSAISSGVSNSDDIEVKYNLMKVLFGS